MSRGHSLIRRAAQAGEILTSEETVARISDRTFRFEPTQSVELKAVPTPTMLHGVWRD